MKSHLPFFAGLLACVSYIAAFSTIKFINHCPYDIFYWAVGPAGSNIGHGDEDRIIVPGDDGTAIHNMVNTESLNGGIALKMRDHPEYQDAPAGILQIEYNLEPSRNAVWYDLSALDCDHSLGPRYPRFCPLMSGGIKMHIPGAAQADCPTAWCFNGRCENVYDRHGSWNGEPTFKCEASVDINVETCTDRVGVRTFQDDSTVDPLTPEPTSQGPLEVSPGGTCGGTTGYTCTGSRWGSCCSEYGYCGQKPEYCDVGCQTAFGTCPEANWTNPAPYPPHSVPTPVPTSISAPSSMLPPEPTPDHTRILTVTETITTTTAAAPKTETITVTKTTTAVPETVTRTTTETETVDTTRTETETETETVTTTRKVFAPSRPTSGGWKARRYAA